MRPIFTDKTHQKKINNEKRITYKHYNLTSSQTACALLHYIIGNFGLLLSAKVRPL